MMQAKPVHRAKWQRRRLQAQLRRASAPHTALRLCLRCGYNLFGTVGGRCPECGWQFSRFMFMVPVWNYAERPGWYTLPAIVLHSALAVLSLMGLFNVAGAAPCYLVPLFLTVVIMFVVLAVDAFRTHLLVSRGRTDCTLLGSRRTISCRRGLTALKQCRWSHIKRVRLTSTPAKWWRLRIWSDDGKKPRIDVVFRTEREIAIDILREIRHRRRRALAGVQINP